MRMDLQKVRIIESRKGDADEDKKAVIKVCEQSSTIVVGGYLEEGELQRKDTQKLGTVPTHELHSFQKGKLNTPSSKSSYLGPPRRIPSIDLPHLSARQTRRGVSDAEKSPVLSKVSTASYSRHTDQGIVGMSSTPTSMFPSVRKRNLPMGYNTAPFSPGQFENQQPPIKVAASGPWFNPLQTADILHRSLQDFPHVSRQKSSLRSGQLYSSQRSGVHSASPVQLTKEMFGVKSSSEPLGSRVGSISIPGQVRFNPK